MNKSFPTFRLLTILFLPLVAFAQETPPPPPPPAAPPGMSIPAILLLVVAGLSLGVYKKFKK